jgi:hypothetical protein
MFTKFELNVLQHALRSYHGPFPDDKNLDDVSELQHKKHLKTAALLAERFEEILYDYYEMENAYLTDSLRKEPR